MNNRKIHTIHTLGPGVDCTMWETFYKSFGEIYRFRLPFFFFFLLRPPPPLLRAAAAAVAVASAARAVLASSIRPRMTRFGGALTQGQTPRGP